MKRFSIRAYICALGCLGIVMWALTLLIVPSAPFPTGQTIRSLEGKDAKGEHGPRPALSDQLHLTYRDPATLDLPENMRARSLAHTRTLPQHTSLTSTHTWVEAGPDILGGRTRAIALDASNRQNVLVGAASGGIWKSDDYGANWKQVSAPGDHLSITDIVQDQRGGFTHTWYASGGEIRGSAGALNSISFGNFAAGLYKSLDNGESWELLESTRAGNPTQLDSPFDYVSSLAVHPTTGTLLVASNGNGIYRSDDGGASFSLVLGQAGQHLYTEIDVAPTGRLVATLSSNTLSGGQTSAGGIFISDDDGITWTPLTPSSYPSTYQRALASFAPSNPDVIYVLTYVLRDASGQEDFRFHKLNVQTGQAEDRTRNLPNYQGSRFHGARLYSFNNFAMTLGVHPTDENLIVLGGIVLYRSFDGFASRIPTYQQARIGGYSFPNLASPLDPIHADFYPNHYVDQHEVTFNPENPDHLWSGNDGGAYLTTNVRSDDLRWINRNTGSYNVSQYYTAFLSDEAGDPKLGGGLQDHGTQFIRDLRQQEGASRSFSVGERISFVDGGHGHFGDEYVITSLVNGQFTRLRYANSERTEIRNVLEEAFSGIATPALQPPQATGFKFYIHPIHVDRSDGKTVYYSDGSANGITATVWRNNDITASNWRSRWERMDTWALPSGYYYSTYASSLNPSHILYLGASATTSLAPPKIYRIDNAHTTTTAPTEIPIPNAPNGAWVHNIAVNPLDADEFIVVLSNYNIVGLYHSSNAGQTYAPIEGNLEGENGAGPSLRAATILPLSQLGDTRTVYFVATNSGFYSTTELDGMATEWKQEARAQMGNVVVNALASRPSDGRVVVGTHGRGMFVGDFNPTPVATEDASQLPDGFSLSPSYPNPFQTEVTIPYALGSPSRVWLQVYDVQGRLVDTLLDGTEQPTGQQRAIWRPHSLSSGSYLYTLEVAPLDRDGVSFQTSRGMMRVR